LDRAISRLVVLLGAIVTALAAVAAAAGVLLRGDLATTPFVTVRGETIDAVTSGIYRYNADSIVAEGVGWDLVTLLVVAPAAAVALVRLWRGSLRAALVMGGLLAYFAYQFFEYAVFWAYGPAYPLHLLIGALSLSSLVLLVWSLDLDALAGRVGDAFPRRAVIAFCGLVVLVLSALWVPQILGTLGGETSDELQGATTMVVPAFDLGILVPLAVFTAVAVWRGLAIGIVLALVLLVKAIVMALAIVAMLLVEWRVTGDLLLPPIIGFALIAVLSLSLAIRAARTVPADPEAARPTAGVRISTPARP
jgi:hypothetical protein